MIEKNQIPTKATVTENSAGYLYGKIALFASPFIICPQTIGPKITSKIAVARPKLPPMTAPLVVNFFQYIDKNRIGKFADAAIAKARPTIKAIF